MSLTIKRPCKRWIIVNDDGETVDSFATKREAREWLKQLKGGE